MSTGQSLDLSDFGLTRLSQIPQSASFKTSAVLVLTLDGNRLSTLDGLEHYGNVVQLSACNNCLVQIAAVQNLPDLVLLNLQNNSLMDVTGLQRLTKLQWLSLKGNSLKAATVLSHNRLLTHLDLSNNCISTLPRLTSLPHLTTLLLHGNVISSLAHMEGHLPPSVKTLSLAENAIADANQLSFLSELPNLEQLMVTGNPCLMWQGRKVDIGPFVLYWCPRLAVLDNTPVDVANRCVAHLLFPKSSQYPFQLGQQAEVAQYLLQIVPHLMHVAHQVPNTSSSADNVAVKHPEMAAVSGTIQQGLNGHTASPDPVTATRHSTFHSGEAIPLSGTSQAPWLPHREGDTGGGGLVKLTGTSEDASVGEGEGNIDDTRLRPPTTAEEKLEILKRLNSAISEHRKKVGVKSILDENRQSEDAPVLPSTEEGQSPLVLQSASVYIPLVSADNKEDSSGANFIRGLHGDLSQTSVMHTASSDPFVHPSQLQQQQTQSTPTGSTCSEEGESDHIEGEEDVARMAFYAIRIQAWWKGCAMRRRFASYVRHERAAVVIQSAWRGILARRHDPKVMWAHSELKQRKMEAYLVLLLHQLKGCQQQVAHNAQVIQLQEETLQGLLADVKSVQDMQDGEEQHHQHSAATVIQKHWRGFVARRSHPDVHVFPSKHIPTVSYSMYRALKQDIDALKAQVHHLGVDGGDNFEGARERYERLGFLHKDPGEEHNHPVAQTVSQSSVACQASVSSAATAPAVPNVETDGLLMAESSTKICPPTNLRMSHYSPSCVQLTWEDTNCAGVLGYNVYVNGLVEGRVGPARRKAYLDGLDATTSYKIAVRAIYKEGESEESNPILASVKMQPNATDKATKRLHFSLPPKELDPPISSIVSDQRTEGEGPQTHQPASTEHGSIQQTIQMHETTQQLLLQSSSADDGNRDGLQTVPSLVGAVGVGDMPVLGPLLLDVTAGVQEVESTSDAKQPEVTPVKGSGSFSPIPSGSPPLHSDNSSTTGSCSSTGQSDDIPTPLEDGSSTRPQDDAVEGVTPTSPIEDTGEPLLVPTSSSGMMSLTSDWVPPQQASSDAVSSVKLESPIFPQEEEVMSAASVITMNLDWDELSDSNSPTHVHVPLPTTPLPPLVNLPILSEPSQGDHISVVTTTTLTGLPPPQPYDHRPSTPTETDLLQTGSLEREQRPRVTTPTSMV